MNKSLQQELIQSMNLINLQILEVGAEADRLGVPVQSLRTPHGDYLMIPLLVARAQVLSALSNLEETPK